MQRESVEHGADWDFQVGQRVRVTEGFLGRVTEVLDGPVSGAEVYIVTLDGGMGGGEYSASELSPDSGTRASTTAERAMDRHEATQAMLEMSLASHDYPELTDILVERPPLENTAALRYHADSWPPSASEMRDSLRRMDEKRKRDWHDGQLRMNRGMVVGWSEGGRWLLGIITRTTGGGSEATNAREFGSGASYSLVGKEHRPAGTLDTFSPDVIERIDRDYPTGGFASMRDLSYWLVEYSRRHRPNSPLAQTGGWRG